MSVFKFLGRPWWTRLVPDRVQVATAALLGQAVMYRVVVRGGGVEIRPRPGLVRAQVVECHFEGTQPTALLDASQLADPAATCWCGRADCEWGQR